MEVLQEERGIGTSLKSPGNTAIVRQGRNHMIKCRFGARFAGLEYKLWDSEEGKYVKAKLEVDTTECYLYNDTGRDGILKLLWKDPPDDGDVRVTRLSSIREQRETSRTEEEDMSNTVELSQEAFETEAAREGGVVAVRIFFKVQGHGSFRAGPFNTADGASSGWVSTSSGLSLHASPAAGWEFSHWELNGNFGGSEPSRSVSPRAGLEIKAVFIEVARGRSGNERWDLSGPNDEEETRVPAGYSRVTYEVDSDSDFSVYVYLNDSALGNLGPGISRGFDCSRGDRPKVKSGTNAQPGQTATGWFVYD